MSQKKKKVKRQTRRARATSFGIFELACNSVGISMADWYPEDVREPAVRAAAEMGSSLNLPGRWTIRPVSAADVAARLTPADKPRKRKKGRTKA